MEDVFGLGSKLIYDFLEVQQICRELQNGGKLKTEV